MIALPLLLILLAVLVWRALRRRHVERAARARRSTGADGIIPGAAAIVRPGAPSDDAVLLLHGFGDTPQTLARVAATLNERGYAVYAPLLPGHGRTLADFRCSGAAAWIDAAREALDDVRARHERVGVVGLSMGGALATIIAAERRDVAALALLAPYLEPPSSVRWLARGASLAGLFAPYLASDDTRSIRDPAERALALGYGVVTPRLVAELVAVADRARSALARVRAPSLYVQSREDNRLTAAGAERAFAALGAPEKRLEWVEGCGHVITVDYERERVAALVLAWMDGRVRREYASAG